MILHLPLEEMGNFLSNFQTMFERMCITYYMCNEWPRVCYPLTKWHIKVMNLVSKQTLILWNGTTWSSKVLDVLMNKILLHLFHKKEIGLDIQKLCNDNCGEYTFRVFTCFCDQGGIEWYFSTPYMPQKMKLLNTKIKHYLKVQGAC